MITTNSALTESYNGTNWTEVGDLNLARVTLAGAGADNTSALAFGGNVSGAAAPVGGRKAETESWNGSNWTEVNDLNDGRSELAGFGSISAAVAAGGDSPGITANVETWNGTNWTETTNLSTARNNVAGSGTSTLGVVMGGSNPGATAATEEWTGAGPVTRTFTDS